MATRFYLRSTTANVGAHAWTELSTTLPVGTFDDSFNAAQDLDRAKGSAETTRSNASLAQTAQQSQYLGKHISEDLGAAGITAIAANTWTIAFDATEGAVQANAFLRVSVYVVTSADAVRGSVYDGAADLGVEFDATGQVVTVAGSAVSGIVSGDRLVCELWIVATQAMATAYTNTVAYNGATDVTEATTSDAASYIETPERLFPPTISAASMADADRNWSTPYQDIAITFTEAVEIIPAPSVGDTVAGLTCQINGGASQALTYRSGNGTTSWKVRTANLIKQSNAVVLDYSRASGVITAVVGGVELADTTDAAVANNLTKRHRAIVKDKNNAVVASTTVDWSIHTYDAGDPANANYMARESKGSTATDAAGLLDVLAGAAAVDAKEFLAIKIPTAAALTQSFLAEDVVT